jgi:hypothetical protein
MWNLVVAHWFEVQKTLILTDNMLHQWELWASSMHCVFEGQVTCGTDNATKYEEVTL